MFLGRPGSVAAGFDRYFWLTAPGLGVTTGCSGSQTSAGHCTWAEYYWGRTSTSGSAYQTGDNVPVYFDHRSSTAWFIFAVGADVESGDWEVVQASTRTSVSVTCAPHTQLIVDDWPPSPMHDDIWHNVRVCQGTLSDMAEQDGTLTMPERFDDFEVEVLSGSDRIGRGGYDTELRLRLLVPTGEIIVRLGAEPIIAKLPLSNAPVGAFVSSGPSSQGHVMCLVTPTADIPSPNAANTCLTDPDGEFIVRYRVPRDAIDLFAMQQDTLRVYVDRDRDGTHDHTPGTITNEPAATLEIAIAKAVNYIALGDSYSSGEAGQSPPLGAYQASVSDADAECRRWDQAYPYVFARDFLGNSNLGIDVSFATYACTGAITLNIHDPADPNPTPPPGRAHDTDRPSPAARPGWPVYEHIPPNQRILLHERDPRWEPRQAVSLADKQAMREADLITLTIGGNDAGFAGTIRSCSLLGCGEVASEVFDTVSERATAVLLHLKSVAPNASVYVLGYPAVTPTFEGCAAASAAAIETFERTGLSPAFVSLGLPSECVDAIREYVDWIRGCRALDGGEALHAVTGIGGIVTDGFAFLFSGELRIDAAEAVHLRNAADGLNDAVRRAAETAGVHFVDVLREAASSRPESSFWDHSPCHGDPWVNGVAVDDTQPWAVSGASFHPNTRGQFRYAEILERDIRHAAADETAVLSEAGLPVNPQPVASPSGIGGGSARSGAGPVDEGTSTGKAQPGEPSDATDVAKQVSDGVAEPTAGYLVARRVAVVSGCGAPFVSPGEQVRLVAGGFAAGATVSFTARAVSLGDTVLTAPTLSAVTADADGAIDVLWSVPSAPAVSLDAAPRAYRVSASGPGSGGGTHTAYMADPLVAYPGAALCAVADTAATTLGQAVTISVLTNDSASAGGTLDAASVRMLSTDGGDFVVNEATGVVDFTPDAGFHGTASATYAAYDNWRVGVVADVTVTVASGCTITGASGATTITGTDGDDVICVPDPDDRGAFHVIDAKGGDDVVIGGAGVEWVYGGDGADTVYGRGGDDRIVAGAGTDTVHGGSGMDHVYSADLADTIVDDDGGYEIVLSPTIAVSEAGPDAGDDWAWVGVSQTAVIDVLGNDHDPNENLDASTLRITGVPASGTATVAETADGATAVQYTAAAVGGSDSLAYEVCDALGECATAQLTIMVGSAGCTITGTEGDDTLRGTPGGDVICGLGGDDVIYGLGGDDTIIGGAGDDSLYGGDETLVGAGDGDDLLWGGAGGDTLYGGNGNDTLYGGAGDDMLYGNRRADRIYGGDGNDTAVGGGENDRIFGGNGDDTLDGHAGDDSVWGGPGVDMLRGGNGDDTLWGDQGGDTLTGGAGADSLYGGSHDDTLDGNTQNDTLWGGDGDDTLDGQGHNDQLHGGRGNDTLRGGAADDHVYGGSGVDSLDGGNGTDHLDGGNGTDACTRGETTAGCETEGRR